MNKKCLVCGKEVSPFSPKKQYCSLKCENIHNRKNNQEDCDVVKDIKKMMGIG